MTGLTADVVAAAREIAETERLLVALDFDGVVAPLQDEPMAARALPESAAAIARLAALPDTTVALVSGRSLADLRVIAEHGDDSPVYLAGSHGAESWYPAGVAAPVTEPDEDALADQPGADAASLLADARAAAEVLPGVWIEPKSFGFALHTRLASEADSELIHEQIDELVASRAPSWRRRTGHDIREYSWRHEGKDVAVATLREMTAATTVLFAGDDVTDEDALRDLGDHDLGVRVGAGQSAARARVADPAEMAELLHLLADEREAAGIAARA